MAPNKKDSGSGKAEGFGLLNWSAPELAEMGKRQVEALVEAQVEVFDALQEWNRDCLASAKSETMLASDIVTKLMNARSLPETGTAYQEWLGRWIGKLAEDSQRLLADGQKVMEASNRVVSNGWGARSA
jgi:phasin protein